MSIKDYLKWLDLQKGRREGWYPGGEGPRQEPSGALVWRQSDLSKQHGEGGALPVDERPLTGLAQMNAMIWLNT